VREEEEKRRRQGTQALGSRTMVDLEGDEGDGDEQGPSAGWLRAVVARDVAGNAHLHSSVVGWVVVVWGGHWQWQKGVVQWGWSTFRLPSWEKWSGPGTWR
jgi:hypothetical protein